MKNSIAEIKKTGKPVAHGSTYFTYQYDVTDKVKRIIGDFVAEATISFNCYECDLLKCRDRLMVKLDNDNTDNINLTANDLIIQFTNGKKIEISISEFGCLKELK